MGRLGKHSGPPDRAGQHLAAGPYLRGRWCPEPPSVSGRSAPPAPGPPGGCGRGRGRRCRSGQCGWPTADVGAAGGCSGCNARPGWAWWHPAAGDPLGRAERCCSCCCSSPCAEWGLGPLGSGERLSFQPACPWALARGLSPPPWPGPTGRAGRHPKGQWSSKDRTLGGLPRLCPELMSPEVCLALQPPIKRGPTEPPTSAVGFVLPSAPEACGLSPSSPSRERHPCFKKFSGMFLPGRDICSHLTPACTSQQELPPPSQAQTYTNRHMHHKPVHHTCRYRRTLICTHTFTVMRLPSHDLSYRCRT